MPKNKPFKYGTIFALVYAIIFLISYLIPLILSGNVYCSTHSCFPIWLMFGFPGMIISIDFGFGKVSPLTAGLITMMLVYLIGYTTAKIIGEAKNIIKPPNWNMKDNNNKNADM